MAKHQGERSTRAQWAKRVRAWKQSGLTAAAFAAREGLVATTLAWWSWQLGRRGNRSTQAEPVRLVPMHLVSPPSAAAAEATTTSIEILCAGCVLRISAGFDHAALIAILDVLEKRTQ